MLFFEVDYIRIQITAEFLYLIYKIPYYSSLLSGAFTLWLNNILLVFLEKILLILWFSHQII